MDKPHHPGQSGNPPIPFRVKEIDGGERTISVGNPTIATIVGLGGNVYPVRLSDLDEPFRTYVIFGIGAGSLAIKHVIAQAKRDADSGQK